MKSKNLVSLSVALVFLVLSVTGLLIYFGQGAHAVEHVHAWFGILFVAAAVFHIVNNWSSLLGYSRERRTGAIRSEFVLPGLIALVFTVGIAADIPMFDKLANAGKNLVRGDRPRRGGPLTQPAIDSIARSVEAAYSQAFSKGDTAALSAVLADKASVLTETGTVLTGQEAQKSFVDASAKNISANNVTHAEALDDNVIVVHGTSGGAAKASAFVYTHVLKRQDDQWRIVAVQTARSSVIETAATAAK